MKTTKKRLNLQSSKLVLNEKNFVIFLSIFIKIFVKFYFANETAAAFKSNNFHACNNLEEKNFLEEGAIRILIFV